LAAGREVAIPRVNRSGMPFQLQLARELVQNQSVVNKSPTGPESKCPVYKGPNPPSH
jgi:hypothetical protein